MRHRIYGRKLGRTKNERTTLFKSLVQALLTHKSIVTTEAKAKAIKGLVDKTINQTAAKKGSGFATMIRIGQQKGDGTIMVRMNLK